MKHWTDEDLILFYYQELEATAAESLARALAESNTLAQRYSALQKLLDDDVSMAIPQPSENLNMRIMQRINAEDSSTTESRSPAQTRSINGVWSWLNSLLTTSRGVQFASISMASVLVIVSVFYLGRLSVEPDDDVATTLSDRTADIAFEPNTGLSREASRRILLRTVSEHLETSQRVLRNISNDDSSSHSDDVDRQQMIDELLVFNRLYRRIAEQSNDSALANVLQQMETILLELNHPNDGQDERPLDDLRQRLDDSDLLFKLKVTDQKLQREMT